MWTTPDGAKNANGDQTAKLHAGNFYVGSNGIIPQQTAKKDAGKARKPAPESAKLRHSCVAGETGLGEAAMSPMRRFMSFRDFDWGLLGIVAGIVHRVGAGNLFGHAAYEVRWLPHKTDLLDCGRRGGHVHLLQNRLSQADRFGAVVLWILSVWPGRRADPRDRPQGAGSTALDQTGTDPVSAFGMDEAGDDPCRGSILRESWSAGISPGRRFSRPLRWSEYRCC